MKFFDRFRNKDKNNREQDPADFTVEEEPVNDPEVENIDSPENEDGLDVEQTPEQVEAEAEQAAESLLDETEELKQLIEENFAEEFEKIRAQFEDSEFDGDQAVAKLKADLLEKLQGQTAKNKFAGILKNVATKFTLPALAGAGLRSVVKSSARAYLGWTSLGASIGLGAIIGGTFAAIESYRKERMKVDSNDVLRQLDEALIENDKVKIAEIIDRGRKELKDGKMFPLEVNQLKVKLQKAELQLRAELSKEKIAELTESERLIWVMNESLNSRKNLRKHEGVKHEKLAEKIKFEMQKNPEFKKKLARNVLIGSAAGAFGGGVGYGVAELLDSEYVRSVFGWEPGEKSSEKITEKAIQKTEQALSVNPSTAEQLTTNIGAVQQEVVNAQSVESLEKAQQELLQQKFTTAAEKGEGATHAARDLIHDYLINKNGLSGKPVAELSPEQLAKLIYAEDALMKEHFLSQTAGENNIVNVGQKFELTGEQIQAAWDKAEKLNPEQLANLTKLVNTPDHNLSDRSLDWLKSDKLGTETNNFYEKIAQQIKPPEVVPVDTITVEAQQEAARVVAEEETKNEAESGSSWKTAAKVAGVVAGVGILGYAGYRVKKAFGDSKLREINEEADARLEDQIRQHDPENQTTASAENSEEEIEDTEIPSTSTTNSTTEAPQQEIAAAAESDVIDAEPVLIDDISHDFNELHRDLLEKNDLELYYTDEPEAVVNTPEYIAALPALIAMYEKFFKGKKLYLGMGESGDQRVFGKNLILDIKAKSLEENLDWLKNLAETEADDEATTIVLPRLDNRTVELVSTTEIEGKEFFKDNNVEIHGHPFNDRELTLADLESAGLEPIYDIKIENTEIRVSKPYYLGGDRIAVTAYVKENDSYVARSYYRSNSSNLWRYLPAYLPNERGGINWYDKAMSEEAITVPSEVQQALAYLSENESDILRIEDPNFYFAGTARDLIENAKRKEEGTIVFEVKKESDEIPGLDSSRKEHLSDPETIEITDPEFKPNFDKKVATWPQASNLYTRPGRRHGVVTVDLFESNNGELRYMFCKDENGRAWLAAIETTGPVKSTGLREKWIKGGDITTPAYEYHSQADGYGNANMMNGNYVDMYEKYISKIPLIKEYLAHSEPKEATPEIAPEEELLIEPQQTETSPTETISSEPAQETIEVGDISRDEIISEAREKGLSKGQTNIWFDLMREDGGYISSAITEKGLSEADANEIKLILKSVDSYAPSGKVNIDRAKSQLLVPIYEKLYTLYEKLEPGKDKDRISKIFPQIKKLVPSRTPRKKINIITEAEDAALKKLGFTRKQLGLK